jgi:hypothetical protein
MKGDCCATCNAWLPNKQANPRAGVPRQGWCRAAPPGVVQVPVQGPLGQQQLGVQGVWPTSNADQWCRGYEAADDLDGETQ